MQNELGFDQQSTGGSWKVNAEDKVIYREENEQSAEQS